MTISITDPSKDITSDTSDPSSTDTAWTSRKWRLGERAGIPIVSDGESIIYCLGVGGLDASPKEHALAARIAALLNGDKLVDAVLAYDLAIQNVAYLGQQWVKDGNLDTLYHHMVDLATSIDSIT